LEPPLCVVSSWIIRVYTILVWNTISGSSNLDICYYHCLILTLIFYLKLLINFFFFFFFFISTTTTTTTTTTVVVVVVTIVVVIVVVVLLLSIIYTINLFAVRPWPHWVIYYFDTPALGRRHQFFGHVKVHKKIILTKSNGVSDESCNALPYNYWYSFHIENYRPVFQVELNDLTRSGRCFTPKKIEKQRKAKRKDVVELTKNDEVNKLVGKEKTIKLLKLMKHSEYSIVDQLKKTPT